MSIWFSKIAIVRIFLILLFINIQLCFLKAQWIKQSPIPTGQEITGVCFVNPYTGWVFGKTGTIFHTNDGGETWIDQSLSSYSVIKAGLFLDSDHGWVALSDDLIDNYGEIYGTIDGGYTWNLQFLDQTCALRDMSFINPDTGWALAYYHQDDPVSKSQNFFLKTINGGDNWFALDSLEQGYFRKMDFINGTEGYIAGAGIPNLMKTVDGGMSWQVAQHNSNAGLTDVFFTDVLNGYSCGNNFYYTHNAGASWNFTYCYHANSVEMYDELNGWTFSINKVYKVTNGGLNVDYQFSVDKSILVDISVVDSDNACIAGREVTILATNNCGETWHEISNGTHNSLYSVYFLNENEGWAGGENRTLLTTHDGGQHWIFNSDIESPSTITDIQFINQDTGWFVNGGIHRSDDGGLTWDQTYGLSHPISDLYFLDAQLGWCVGSDGRIFKSMNGGIDWEEKNSSTDKNLNAVYFINENLGWIAGEGIVKKTTDGGENWDESYTSSAEFLKIQFFDDAVGYVLTDSLYIKTYSGGDNWQVVVPEGMTDANSLEDFCFINQDVGYLTGNNYLLKTTDGGATWESNPGLPDMQFNAIFFVNELMGWIAGADGAIYHTETGGAVSIKNPENEDEPSSYIIFPNPSGDVFKIRYMLENKEDVEIGIYTLQGIRISYQKETCLSPGNYSFGWDPACLPTGIYLCKIRIGSYTYTEKIVYIK